VDRADIADVNRIVELSEVYEALDTCAELERVLGRLARADTQHGEEWFDSKAQVRCICSRVERHLRPDA
jgi:DNA-binding transcriptional regulator YbjK